MSNLLQSAKLVRTVLERSQWQRQVVVVSSLLGSSASATATATATDAMLTRSFSSFSIRRPPQRQEQPGDMTADKSKLRTHAVSLQIGDYTDNTPESASRETADNSWEEEELQLSQLVKESNEKEQAQKQKWLDAAKPPVRVSQIDNRGRAYGRGGRKAASARVWIQPGFGLVTVNRLEIVEYFERMTDRERILSPLAATATLGKMDVTAYVRGGGLAGQAGAIRHGVARALNAYNPDTYRPPLKRLGYLTRDPRKVERKKIGHVKARKMPQWVKR
jgi:small subunit ribosomal protein S9